MNKNKTKVRSWKMASEVEWVGLNACVFMPLCQNDHRVCVEHSSVNVPDCAVTFGVCGFCVCTCIRALSTSQHRWRGGYIGSFCRSQTSTQGRGLVRWPGKPHHVAGCPVACSDHWGVCPSCSLQAEKWKRVQWKQEIPCHLHPPTLI